jgi:hypothetical protein
MQKLPLLIAVSVLLLGFNTQPSEAAPAWKCAKRHCYWVEGYTGQVPDYAANWGPPRQAGCYYALGIVSKRWNQVCPPS